MAEYDYRPNNYIYGARVAHIAQFDNRLNRIAFTSEITSREKLQHELQAFSFLKRKAPPSQQSAYEDAKRQKTTKFFSCGRIGHIDLLECRSKPKVQEGASTSSVMASTLSGPAKPRSSTAVICFPCGTTGYYASKCPRASGGDASSGGSAGNVSTAGSVNDQQRRVDLCSVGNP